MKGRTCTSLYNAAFNGDLAAVEKFIAAGETIIADTISAAAQNNHAEIITFLANNGADLNGRESVNGATALLLAAYFGKTNAVKALLDNKADIKLIHKNKDTALLSAILGGHASTLNLLVTHAINKLPLNEFMKFMREDNHLQRCLESAKSKEACIELKRLLDHMLTSKIDHKTIIAMLPNKYTFGYYYFKEIIFKAGQQLQAHEQVKAFGDMLRPEHPYGYIMWMQRGSKPCREHHGLLKKIAAARFKAADRPQAEIKTPQSSATSADLNATLYNAVRDGDVKKAGECLAKGADVYTDSGRLNLLLNTAANSGNTAIVDLLLRYGAIHVQTYSDVNSSIGISALFCAVRSGHLDTAKLLLANNTRPNIERKSVNSSALAIAAQYGHLNIVRTLLESGADIDAAMTHNNIALTLASIKYQAPILQLLINHMIKHYEPTRIYNFLKAKKQFKELIEDAREERNNHLIRILMRLITHLADNQFDQEALKALLPAGVEIPTTAPVAATPAQTIPEQPAAPQGLYPTLQHADAAAPQSDSEYDKYMREHPVRPDTAMSAIKLAFSTTNINAALAQPLQPIVKPGEIVIEFSAVNTDAVVDKQTVEPQIGELFSLAANDDTQDTEETKINVTLMTLGTLFTTAVSVSEPVTDTGVAEVHLARLDALETPTHTYISEDQTKSNTKTMVPN